MKNLIFLFVLALFTSTVQSQSLTEKEITGTWQVMNIAEVGNNPKQAQEMNWAYIDLYPDHKFQLRKKTSKGYKNTFNNATWSFDQATQTITTSDGRFTIKASKNNDKMIFELSETGITLEVVMPI